MAPRAVVRDTCDVEQMRTIIELRRQHIATHYGKAPCRCVLWYVPTPCAVAWSSRVHRAKKSSVEGSINPLAGFELDINLKGLGFDKGG